MIDHFRSQVDEYLEYLSDCEYIEECRYFINIALNYFEETKREKYKVGVTSTAFPELFIRASGAIPVYLFGGYEGNTSEVEEIFPQISDHAIKASMNLLFDEKMSFENSLKGVIVPITNDSNRKMATYLKEKGYKVLSVDTVPFVLEQTAGNYIREQKNFLRNLTKLTKQIMTKKRLLEAARKITISHNLFLRIDESALETKLKIFLKETYYLTTDIDQWQREMELLLDIVPISEEQDEALLLMGGQIQFPSYKIGLILEETSITHYKTQCCVPYPYDYSELDETQSFIGLYKQILDIHYRNQYSSEALGDDKLDFDEHTKAVVFHLLKGQLLSAYYADKVEKNCIAQNIPFLCIETDYTKADKEPVKPLIKLLKWVILVCLMFGIGFCRLCPVKYIMQPLAGSFPGFNIWGVIIAGVTAGLCFMKESIFCMVCPLGTLMGLLHKVSGAKIKKCGGACTHCRACTEVCPMGIEGIYQLRNNPDVTHPDCIFCMKCIDACPEQDALSVSLLGKTILTSKRGIVEDGNKS